MMSVAAPARADVTLGSPGYLPDYQYQVANLASMADAQALMDSETKDTSHWSICENRAEVWSYIMARTQSVQVGKVVIHFTAKGQAREDTQWAYHVAPYVLVNGEEYVLDGGFGDFHHQPVKLSEWEKHFGTSPNCVVLDPTKNPAHLALESNNLPAGQTPFTFNGGAARQYPSTEGVCYVRKTPMYYLGPEEYYAADLALAGDARYAKFVKTSFDAPDVYNACSQALTVGAKLKKSCSDYLGIDKPKKDKH